MVKDVLTKEAHLQVRGDRFYNIERSASYPIKVVIYNSSNTLGYFDSNFLELGFHERLMHTSKTVVCNIVRHELAHYLTFMIYGDTKTPHSKEFQLICSRFGWGKEISEAAIAIENVTDLSESPIHRKVQKLMALSSSSNKHEAELAIIKSRELL